MNIEGLFTSAIVGLVYLAYTSAVVDAFTSVWVQLGGIGILVAIIVNLIF